MAFKRSAQKYFLQLIPSDKVIGNLLPKAKSTEAIKEEPDEITVVPEITTFSDNVIVSYPNATQLEEHIWTEIVCKDAIRIVCQVAEMGLRVGVLTRGGLSFGRLHHSEGVVFGEALVDAHALERKVANFPRIVVSERVITKLNQPEYMKDILLRDADAWHLNYFREMMRGAVPSGAGAIDDARLWKRTHLECIDRNIAKLSHRRLISCVRDAVVRVPASPRAKWEWFKTRFEAATSPLAG